MSTQPQRDGGEAWAPDKLPVDSLFWYSSSNQTVLGKLLKHQNGTAVILSKYPNEDWKQTFLGYSLMHPLDTYPGGLQKDLQSLPEPQWLKCRYCGHEFVKTPENTWEACPCAGCHERAFPIPNPHKQDLQAQDRLRTCVDHFITNWRP